METNNTQNVCRSCLCELVDGRDGMCQNCIDDALYADYLAANGDDEALYDVEEVLFHRPV